MPVQIVSAPPTPLATNPTAPKVQPARAAAKVAPKPIAPTGYNGMVNAWHKVDATEAQSIDERGTVRLVLHAINTREKVALTPLGPDGGFRPTDLERAAHLLRDPRDGGEHPVEPRTLDFVYRIQRHFDAPLVRVISGYRTPHGGHSNHGRGRAIDLVVPGVKDEDVAAFARQEGFVGVGVYPVSGFVHVDMREHSYFWLDASGPGRKNHERGILPDVATKSDEIAAARGAAPVPHYGCSTNVLMALGVSAREAREARDTREVQRDDRGDPLDDDDSREDAP